MNYLKSIQNDSYLKHQKFKIAEYLLPKHYDDAENKVELVISIVFIGHTLLKQKL